MNADDEKDSQSYKIDRELVEKKLTELANLSQEMGLYDELDGSNKIDEPE